MKRSACAKIAGLAILEIALISLLFVPIQTHAVLVNVPRDASHQATSQFAEWFPVIAVIAATYWLSSSFSQFSSLRFGLPFASFGESAVELESPVKSCAGKPPPI